MKRLWTPLLIITLTSCTTVGPTHTPPSLTDITVNSPAWNARVPHAGKAAQLKNWWASWNDTALSALIDAAQKNNATVAQAQTRIAQARLTARLAGNAQVPEVAGSSSLTRDRQGGPVATRWASAAQAAWELDLFGGKRREREAASARVQAREWDWHDARVSLAAEVASAYASIRVSEALVKRFEQNRMSQLETARLTSIKAQAGFEAPANAALANAAVAEAQSRIDAQRTEIDLGFKALTALTELPESVIRELALPNTAMIPGGLTLDIATVPAQALAQRPDLASLERELAALVAEVGVAQADRYPKITLSGSIGYSVSRALGITTDGLTWSFGPAISLPLFDADRRATNVELVQARHRELTARYRLVATQAVREVEEALTKIASASARESDLRTTMAGYEAFARAAQARLEAGVGSVLELEDARRSVLNAQVSALNLERERLLAWVALYRAVGGGWNDETVSKG
jgi:NodT family efflux transporter outer membrane factor (OMF) lipoprotein